jgi:hypothetical protein
MSISSDGLASLSFIAAIRVCPPASSLASGERANSCSASDSVFARAYLKE